MTFLFAPLTHYLYPLAWSSCTEQPVGESGLVTSAMEQTARINERLRKLVWPRLCFTCCYTTVDHPNPNERLSPPRPVPRGRQHFGMSWLCRSARCSKGMPQATGLSPIAVFDSRNSRKAGKASASTVLRSRNSDSAGQGLSVRSLTSAGFRV